MFLGFHLQDMLGASMDTSPSTLEWALYEFNLHLEIMRKVQKELDTVVGKNKLLLYSNLPNSSYKTLLRKILFTPSNSISNPSF
jgi:flavonoid 3',5'-hydroxylase